VPLSASIRYLQDYVAIPSVNAMRRVDLPAEIVGERRYAEHLSSQLRRLGMDVAVIGDGERRSVVAEATVAGAKETVLIASHLDTVPVDAMEIPPFEPRIDCGRLYGRGSCDTKAGMAAAVAALEPLLAAGRLRCNVLLVGEADEECGSIGVRVLLEKLGARRPDWALATEPTEMRVVTHHKGIAQIRLAARGVACHSSDPGAGRSAIVDAARAVLSLEALSRQLAERRDPRLGSPTLSVGLISGGQAVNIVPDHASLTLDRRLIPGETERSIAEEIRAAFARDGVEDVTLESCSVEKPALATAADHPSVRACLAALARVGVAADVGTAAFATDASLLTEAGIPAIVLGPGSIAQAHTATEFVAIEQVELATRFFTALLER
jgi:acetylornithine deacetylase/succinyl-diaminopimelate desuccinylase-like protein